MKVPTSTAMHAFTPAAPEGPEITAPPAKDTRSPEQRARARLMAAVHAVRHDMGDKRYLSWTEFRDAVAKGGTKMTGVDWHDLQPLLSVTLNSMVDEERPRALCTYVDWQGVLAVVGE